MNNYDNYPESIRVMFQNGFVVREFEAGLRAKSAYRDCADRKPILSYEFPTTLDIQPGLQSNTNEACEVSLSYYTETDPFVTDTDMAGVAVQILHNAYVNGERAGRVLETLALNALLAAYMPVPEFYDDYLNAEQLKKAVKQLRDAKVPEIDSAYNCYIDPISAMQLFCDPKFKQLYPNASTVSHVIKDGALCEPLGIRFRTMLELYTEPHPSIKDVTMRRLIVCGQGALIEAGTNDLKDHEIAPERAVVEVVNGVAMMTRLYSSKQGKLTLDQGWYWDGDYAAPIDQLYHRPLRAVMLEHCS